MTKGDLIPKSSSTAKFSTPCAALTLESVDQNMGFNYTGFWWVPYHMIKEKIKRQLRARRALTLFNDVPLRFGRAISLYKVYADSALLVLNG